MSELAPQPPVAEERERTQMKNAAWFIGGILVGIAIWIAALLVVAALGVVNMGATTHPGSLERTLAPWVVDKSRARRAPPETDPYTNAVAVATGLDHYREDCVICHGAPNVEAGEIAQGLNPRAPKLQSRGTQSMSDGELFWTIKYGVRMTGMPAFAPTHTDEQIWKIVAFVRHLPKLTRQEEAELRKGPALETK
jgi:mono/diheme cytochrome c family protein